MNGGLFLFLLCFLVAFICAPIVRVLDPTIGWITLGVAVGGMVLVGYGEMTP